MLVRPLFSLAIKLIASGLLVAVFLVMTARLPYLEQGSRPVSWDSLSGTRTYFTPVTFTGEDHAEITFADANALFSGQFYLAEEGVGFETREIDVDGPCENAGRRYLEQHCAGCDFSESPPQPGLPPTLFWFDVDQSVGESGNILRDCVAEVPGGKVRLAMITYQSDQLQLTGPAGDGSRVPSSALPEVPGATRVSVMSLGEWSVIVDEIPGTGAMAEMERRLLGGGWEIVPASTLRSPDGGEQRTFKRSATELCVVTQALEGDTLQLITMTNGF